jgi:hypothetical protein
MATICMKNVKDEVLYSGVITEECLKYIVRYDDESIDLDKVTCKINYSYNPKIVESELESKMIKKLNEYEYSAFGDGENRIIWTMK